MRASRQMYAVPVLLLLGSAIAAPPFSLELYLDITDEGSYQTACSPARSCAIPIAIPNNWKYATIEVNLTDSNGNETNTELTPERALYENWFRVSVPIPQSQRNQDVEITAVAENAEIGVKFFVEQYLEFGNYQAYDGDYYYPAFVENTTGLSAFDYDGDCEFDCGGDFA